MKKNIRQLTADSRFPIIMIVRCTSLRLALCVALLVGCSGQGSDALDGPENALQPTGPGAKGCN